MEGAALRGILNAFIEIILSTLLGLSGGYVLSFTTIKKYKINEILLITLYEKKYLDEVIEVLISNAISGISILDSRGKRSVLSNVPLFSEFINFTGERSEVSKTILAVVDRDRVSQIVEGIETIMCDLNKHTGAMVLVLDTHYIKGTLEVI